MPQNFQPDNYTNSISAISTVTNGGLPPTIQVTTTSPNQFVTGQLVRFLIPPGWGITQLNNQLGFITDVISSTQFIVNIDPTGFNAFVTPSAPLNRQVPQCVCVGDDNLSSVFNKNIGYTTLGAFINVSP
ncbi:MAG TPA: hypothetical protein VFX43_09395 [Chitinophagaceae bacterium]|nr:hypothetical protein [Chitinophagaceae bacterium]